MGDTKRTLLAGFLIAGLTLLIPFYLQMIGVSLEDGATQTLDVLPASDIVDDSAFKLKEKKVVVDDSSTFFDSTQKSKALSFYVVTEKYQLGFSSVSGGSLESFVITDGGIKKHQYFGGYDSSGRYNDSLNVELLGLGSLGCSPCLKNNEGLINIPFSVVSPVVANGQTINLAGADSLVVVMEGFWNNQKIIKKTSFFGDKYLINHLYFLENVGLDAISVAWMDGLKTTEKNLTEELTYSEAYVAQNKDIESVHFTPSDISDVAENLSFSGSTDWVGIRNKYFINALISDQSVGGFVGGKSFQLDEGLLIPKYSMGLNFKGVSSVGVRQYLGPLDVDLIAQSNTYLDRIMNFGWLPIQPFSRLVLWLLKSLRLLGLNYGIILIVFALLIRFLTGPLTKKSFQSSQKMQSVQPKMKKIQEKFKNDSQKLNQEMIKLYKEEGVNPMGGCLPMLIQMPLLFSLFIVFRSTIEFRGAPFFWWITDLSQPDVLFNLPFNIPIYGAHVGFLPIVLGVSMFMSQRLSMASMDPKQKPMMYFMTAFFFLLFNQFPSGLNLYYTMYNILNYFQQKNLKKV